jgi:mycothiol synthase
MEFRPTSDVVIARCDPSLDEKTLSLAARAWPAAEESAYRQAIDAALSRSQKADVVLLAARRGGTLAAAQLAQLVAGRAAIVWPPQFAADVHPALARLLFAKMTTELASAGVRFAQSLLAVGDDNAKLYLDNGFTHGADLLYLTADVRASPANRPQLPFDIESFRPRDEPRLAALIERSYSGTLDCPRLDGLRQTADVIDGYKAVGAFRPDLWLFARHEDQDVGCLLLNVHPDVRHAEIVYVALVPEVRGRGWGAELTRLSLWLGQCAGAERLVLAVDAANKPAIHIYEDTGFFEFDRRGVWIQSLTEILKAR